MTPMTEAITWDSTGLIAQNPNLVRSKVPDKFSDLILLAVADVEFQLKYNDKFVIDMESWIRDSSGLCSACLAGCTIMTSFPNAIVHYTVERKHARFDVNWEFVRRNKDYARITSSLNAIRSGFIITALDIFTDDEYKMTYAQEEAMLKKADFVTYKPTDRVEPFLTGLKKIAKQLKQLNL